MKKEFFFSCLENIALHKQAWQKYPLDNAKLRAFLAVDGKQANLSHWGGDCVSSRYGRTAQWRVDLNDILSIHHIVIQYVQYNAVWGISFLFRFV